MDRLQRYKTQDLRTRTPGPRHRNRNRDRDPIGPRHRETIGPRHRNRDTIGHLNRNPSGRRLFSVPRKNGTPRRGPRFRIPRPRAAGAHFFFFSRSRSHWHGSPNRYRSEPLPAYNSVVEATLSAVPLRRVKLPAASRLWSLPLWSGSTRRKPRKRFRPFRSRGVVA